MCDFDGKVAYSTTRKHRYYTHVIVKNGETFRGKTCSMRKKERDGLIKTLLNV